MQGIPLPAARFAGLRPAKLPAACGRERSRMEAPGIEPGSRDVSMPASTCIVAFLILADRARSDAVPHGQDDQVSRRRNHPTRRRQARCFSPVEPRGQDPAGGLSNQAANARF